MFVRSTIDPPPDTDQLTPTRFGSGKLAAELLSLSAAAAGAAAAFANVAGTRRAHLGAAGHAERAVDGASGDLLQELGGGVGFGRGGLNRGRCGLDTLARSSLGLDHRGT